jgi:hypothetical protein
MMNDHVADADRIREIQEPRGGWGTGAFRRLLDPPDTRVSVYAYHHRKMIRGIRRGEHLPLERLAELLRFNRELPRDIRDYIAGRLDGSIKPRGRPTPAYDPGHRNHKAQRRIAAMLVRLQHRRNRAAGMKSGQPGSADPYLAALQQVADETGIKADTLDKYVHPRKHRDVW